jgi:CDGSH iron-sulfur domain-containing protein 3
MSEPMSAGDAPIQVAVEAGKMYWWCACGRSASQPFCDGSHKGLGLQPVGFRAERSETLWLCTCKRTRSQPRCDGSHRAR